ncbi:MAG: hypothetical protein AUG50_02750 [Betaproteobacteria bacterium 13_1_20CM_3_63_8]|nr:MAG: hypothetical protein AUG50_02750 [Betaproteobacteria bacterium 13_1_20CM_3_63_8]
MIGAAMRNTANQDFARRADATTIRRVVIYAFASLLFLTGGIASAQPTVTISPPQVKGQDGSTPVPSVATDQAAAKRIEEERRNRKSSSNALRHRSIVEAPNLWPARSTTAATSTDRTSAAPIR